MNRILLLLIILFASSTSYAESTRDAPRIVSCNTCITQADFEKKASYTVKANTIEYILIYNESTETLKSLYIIDETEPEIGYNNKEVHNLNNLDKHVTGFFDFLQYRKNYPPKVINYPHDIGIPATDLASLEVYANYARQQIIGTNPFYAGSVIIVVMKFNNGYTIFINLHPMSRAFTFMGMTDQNGKTVNPGSTGGSSGGGSSGGTSGSSGTLSFSVPVTSPSGNVGSLSCTFHGTTLTCRRVN